MSAPEEAPSSERCGEMIEYPDENGRLYCWRRLGHDGMHWDKIDNLWWGVVTQVVTEPVR